MSSSSTHQGSTAALSTTTIPLARPRGSLPDYVDSGVNVSPATARIDLVKDDLEGTRSEYGTHVTLRAVGEKGVDISWKAFALASNDVICELFNIFMQITYPM